MTSSAGSPADIAGSAVTLRDSPSSMTVKQAEGGPSKRLARDGAKGKRASEGPAEGIGEGQARGVAGRLKGLVDKDK